MSDGLEQSGRLYRLLEDRRKPGFSCPSRHLEMQDPCGRNHRNMSGARVGDQPTQYFEAIELWNGDFRDNHVRESMFGDTDGGLAVGHAIGYPARVGQHHEI
jgi:hypothetical protein